MDLSGVFWYKVKLFHPLGSQIKKFGKINFYIIAKRKFYEH
jgi:hypothetical protein